MTSEVVHQLIAAGLPDGIVVPGSADYDRRRRIWNAVVDRRPAAIVRPTTAEGVAAVVRAAAECDALLSVRCGGHSFPGHSTCEGGVVLDLSAMNSVTLDPPSGRCVVGGGALLGDVDRAAVPHGLAVPAGVVSHTGVGGLTLGGGMGWLSRVYGLTIDSLVGVDIVTADGALRRASLENEPDLFWALRGGGGNFGVVVAFEFQARALGPVSAGRWVYPPADIHDAMLGAARIAADGPRELTVSFSVSRLGVAVTAFWAGAPSAADAALAPFGRLAASATGGQGPVSFLDLQTRTDQHSAWGRRYYAKGGFVRHLDAAVVDHIADAVAEGPTDDAEVYVPQLGGAVRDVGEDATAYSGREAGFYWLVEPIWDDPADDVRCLAWGRRHGGRLAALSMEANYVNEQADTGGAFPEQAYGSSKYRRLREIKARYDPTNLFRLNANIEPAGHPPGDAARREGARGMDGRTPLRTEAMRCDVSRDHGVHGRSQVSPSPSSSVPPASP
jgi:FAD/FMN-containing dehydrogenase